MGWVVACFCGAVIRGPVVRVCPRCGEPVPGVEPQQG